MKKKLIKWNRQRRFIKAYRILRNESERHRGSGHDVRFEAVNQSHIMLECINCPCLNPYGPKRVY